MHLVAKTQERIITPSVKSPRSEALALKHLLENLPSEQQTDNNIELLKTYFLIPQHSVRCFVLVLFARITGDRNTTHPVGDTAEAQYLLKQYGKLPNGDVSDKMLALVRQVCAVNRSEIPRM